jgi:hypothetical protein
LVVDKIKYTYNYMNSEIIIFLSTICTGLLALLGLIIRYSFLSKCIKIKCCCCEIERDIIHEASIQNNNSPNQHQTINNSNNNLSMV